MSEKQVLREAWLEQASAFLIEHMVQHGLAQITARVSCGWPSRGGIGDKKRVIGQCFDAVVCRDGKPQIFISPTLDESITVLGTLLHELVHASVGCEHGHRAPFSQAARAVGLAGPPTATVVGDGLKPLLQDYVKQAGEYPHAAIQLATKEKKGSRLRLYECGCEKPIKVRVASDDLHARCLVCGLEFALVQNDE